MTTIDDALIVKDILEDNYVAANVSDTTPTFYYDDSIKNHDYRTDAVKIYVRSGPQRKGRGLGYMYNEITTGVTVDLRSSNRDRMLLLRDELVRCLNSARIAPTSYDVILFDSDRQLSGYAGFWHYVIEITLKKYFRQITT